MGTGVENLFAWDFHGTLCIDNELAVVEIINQLMGEFDIRDKAAAVKKVDKEYVLSAYGDNWSQYFRRLAPSADDAKIFQMVKRAVELNNVFTLKYIKPTPHSHEVLATIKERGDVNTIVSIMLETDVDMFLNSVGIMPYIKETVALPPLVKDNKISWNPQFDVVEFKAQKFAGLKEKYKPRQLIVIDDYEAGVEAGLRVGAAAYRFVNGRPAESIKSKGRVINDLRQVLGVYGL